MGYIPFSQIIDALSNLEPAQKEMLLKILQETVHPLITHKTIATLNELRENHFKNGLTCIFCGSTWIQRFGHYRGRQRYYCKSCQRTFNDLSNTPIHRTKHLVKWGEYLKFMVEGYSVRKCAKLLKINKDTAFVWRHKILHAMTLIPVNKLQGIVEADETYELFSTKGTHPLTRKPRKRGGVAKKRGISNEQVCILVARDRNKNTSCQMTGLGRINSSTLKQRIGSQIVDDSIFCSDEEPSFKTFCRQAKLLHITINSKDKSRVKDGVYHIQNVNSFHSRYKLWEDRFKGIATKYLDNYLTWFNFLDKTACFESRKQLKQLLLEFTSYSMKTCGIDLPSYYESRLLAVCG